MKQSQMELAKLLFIPLFCLIPEVFYGQERSEAGSPQKPNVIVFLSDDQGWGDFGFQGNTNFETPNLDRIASEGAVLQNFYVCPVCSPTRAEFLTGRYHLRGGVTGVSEGRERLDLSEVTLANLFANAGYQTGAFGKWHNGTQMPYHPNGRGFNEYYGFCSGHWGHYFSPPLDHNGIPVRGNGYVTDDFTDHAITFIRENQERPFFCFLAYNTPHSPMQAPDRNYERVIGRDLKMQHQGRKNEIEDLAMTRAAIAMVENIDENVGRVLDELDRLKIADETIVVYFNDNGPNSFRWNGGMRGRKGTVNEGGTRSPLLLRWPGQITAGSRPSQLAGAIDLLPTLCRLAKVPTAGTLPLDGIDLSPYLGDEGELPKQRLIFSHWGKWTAVRDGTYLYINNGELFNLREDPFETENLAKSDPQRAERMAQAIQTWLKDVKPNGGDGKKPFTVAHPNAPTTILPARDAIGKGPSIRRSASAPNCSYFKNWTQTEDTITWDVEILTAGRFDVAMKYTCPEICRDAEIELSLGTKTLRTTIDQPFTSSLYGAQDDRVVRRGESYMKDFATLHVGVIDLERTSGQIRLQLLQNLPMPGLELHSLSMTPADIAKQTHSPERKTRNVLGWHLHIQKQLLDDKPGKTERAILVLAKQLEEIVEKLPPHIVKQLRQVPLFFSVPYPQTRGGAEYHPDSGWLHRNGRDPWMARAVEFTNIENFEAEANRMPNFALHELAHAYHHRFLRDGYENASIQSQYDAVKDAGIYSNVERWLGNGRPSTVEKAYAMTSPMEYFAESTEAFFSRNDFFPFNRDELLRHDPEMALLLKELWELP